MASQTEQNLLEKIKQGFLRFKDDEIECWDFRKRRWFVKKAGLGLDSGRRRFHFGKKRNTVQGNRLVWMLVHKKLIPEGFYVDHIDEDCTNDKPNNLQLMSTSDSGKQGNRIQGDCVLEYLGRWFWFVAKYGRGPETMEEVSYVEVGF